jgi:hypothetical protein
VEGQNGPPLESPKTAAEKAGFQPGDEWEGIAGPGRGNKVRGQNDLTVKPTTPGPDETGSGFFMSSSQDNPGGKAVRVQNEPAQDNPGGKMHASKMNACTPRIKIGYVVKMTTQPKPRKPPRQAPQLYYKC